MARRSTQLLGIAGLLLAPALTACDSPTTPVTPEVLGTWTGQYAASSCTGGSDPRDCRNVVGVGTAPTAYPFRLAISSQRNGAISGTLTLGGPPVALTDQPFEGSVDTAGLIRFELAKDVLVCGVTPATARVTNWRSRLLPGGLLEGSFTFSVPVGPVFCIGDVSTAFTLTTENQLLPAAR